MILICTRRLARFFGCDRRPSKAIELLIERQFRFTLSCDLSAKTEIANCYSIDVDLPLQEAALEHVKRSRRDESIDLENRKVIVDIHPFWPIKLAISRIHFWTHVAPHLSLQIWSTSEEYCEHVRMKLAPRIAAKISDFQIVSDPISMNYLSVINKREAHLAECAGDLQQKNRCYKSATNCYR